MQLLFTLHRSKRATGCSANLLKEQCAAHGGYFIPSSPIVPHNPNPTGQCRISLAQERAIDLCRSSGSQWIKGAYRTYYCFNPKLQQECVAKGGNWQPEGMAGIPGCVMTSVDAGRVCKDGSECQFKLCTYKGARLEPGSIAYGTCAPTSSHFGCFVSVQNGRVGGEMCVD
jgi:hypothetical protein